MAFACISIIVFALLAGAFLGHAYEQHSTAHYLAGLFFLLLTVGGLTVVVP